MGDYSASVYRFISYNKCTTAVRDVENMGRHVYVEAGSMWGISVPSPHFAEPKIAPKLKS